MPSELDAAGKADDDAVVAPSSSEDAAAVMVDLGDEGLDGEEVVAVAAAADADDDDEFHLDSTIFVAGGTTDETAVDPSLAAPEDVPRGRPPGGEGYYAVRVKLPPPFSSAVKFDVAPPASVGVAVRSAIFLSWDDAKSYVEYATNANNKSATNGDNVVEYRRFDDVEGAERYLRRSMPGYDPTAEANRRAKIRKLRLMKKKKKKKKENGKKLDALKATNKIAKIKSTLLRGRVHGSTLYPPPAKNFNAPTRKWLSMYDAALQYKTAHGNLDVTSGGEGDEQHAELAKWIKYQRNSYRYYLEDPLGGRHSMTEYKVNKLMETGFAWIIDDRSTWLAEVGGGGGVDANSSTGGVDDVQIANGAVKKKRGRPRKTARMRLEENLEAAAVARVLASASGGGGKDDDEGGEDDDDADDDTPRPIRPKWLASYEKLRQYKEANGTTDIGPDETDGELANLRLWIKNQKSMHSRWIQGHDVGMTKEKVDMLKKLGMEFPPSWGDFYARILQHKALNSDSLDGLDPALSAWLARQNDVLGRHLQGKSTRLTDEQAMRLLSLGYQDGGRRSSTTAIAPTAGKSVASRDFDARWNEMWLKLKEYKAENGHCNVPTSNSTDLALWVAAQRRMYNKLVAGKPGKRASLDAVKMQRLTELGFAFRPRGSYAAWDDQIKGVWEFKNANGHCRIPVNHPTLGSFVKLVRRDYKNWSLGKPSSMTPEREAALKEVGFAFEGGKTPQRADAPIKTWDERLEELLQYKAEYGHTVVPQNSGQLGAWVHSQRVHYKRYKNGQTSQMTALKALKLTEIGFCFNASDRYRGNKRHRTTEQQEEEEAQLQLQIQQQQGYQQMHQIQDTILVPQGFQAYM